jgi:hypothetical protein
MNIYWRDDWGHARDLARALEYAADDYAEDPDLASWSAEEMRAAMPSDVPDYTESVVRLVAECLWESETLTHNDGGADLPWVPDSPEAAALREALRAYVEAHVDMSDAAVQSTGRVLRVERDGTWRVEEVTE